MKYAHLFLLALFALRPLPLSAPELYAAQAESSSKQVEDDLDSWRLPEAKKIVSRLLAENGKSPAALELAARVGFYEGRYEEAQRLIDQALSIDSANKRGQALRLLIQQTLDATKRLKRFESAHFILALDEEKDGILAPLALETLEKSYQQLGRTLGYFPQAKVRVEIAPDAPSFNAISTLSLRDIEETGAVGICKFNKIMTISPRALMRGYRWLDSLSHEYVHYVIVGVSGNKVPIWLHEGIARFYETLWRDPRQPQGKEDYLTPANQTLLAQALDRNQFVPFEKMEPSLIYLETPEQVQLAYAEAASAVDFMVQRKGSGAVRELLTSLARSPTKEAIASVLGDPYPAFEREWKGFLKAKGLKEIEGIQVRKLKVKGSQKEDEETVELKEIQSVVARNRTHLGDELRERGRMAAAVQEYRRALQASPYSPIILNKLARALIQGGRYEEALPHLKKAQELEPDSVGAYIQLGRLYDATKNFSAARAALEEAVEINPFDPTIYGLLAQAYAALGQPDQAKNAGATLGRLTGSK